MPLSGWLSILHLGAVVSVMAFALWFKGIRDVPASTAGAFTGPIPVGTIVAAAIVLDEPVTRMQIVAVVIAVDGIVLVARGMRPHRVVGPDGHVGVATRMHGEAHRPP